MTALAVEMRAAVLYGKEDIRVERVPVPALKPGEVLIKVGAALTCGTDLKVFRRGYHAAMIKPPSVFGHECAGTVVAARPAASSELRFKLGEHIVAANSAPCGSCYFCLRNQENLCADLQFLNGAYSEYLVIPVRFVEKNAYAIPEKISFEEAAMTEPLACVVHGLEETNPTPGERVAVLGLGPIGLMFVALLKARGCQVVAVGRHAPRLNLARKLGADVVIEADAEDRWLPDLKKGELLDVVIEATGLPVVWHHAVALVRRGGRVNFFGGCPESTQVSFDTQRLHYDQIMILSSFHHRPADIRTALEAIANGVIRPNDFITEERTLEELPALFKEMLATKRQVKACIRP